MKKVLIHLTKGPFDSLHALEALDVAMMAATMEQEVTLLLSDAGVQNLVEVDDSQTFHRKNITKTFKALPFYDVENISVEQQSLVSQQLDQDVLSLDVECINKQDIAALEAKHDYILRF